MTDMKVGETVKAERIEEGKKRLEEIERRVGRFMPKGTMKEGVKRGEWRSDYPLITDNHPKERRKKVPA